MYIYRGELQSKTGQKDQTQGHLKKKITDMQRQIKQTMQEAYRYHAYHTDWVYVVCELHQVANLVFMWVIYTSCRNQEYWTSYRRAFGSDPGAKALYIMCISYNIQNMNFLPGISSQSYTYSLFVQLFKFITIMNGAGVRSYSMIFKVLRQPLLLSWRRNKLTSRKWEPPLKDCI